VGVNAGSLDKDILARHGSAVPEALVESALLEIRYLEEVDFTDIKISVKHSHVPSMVDSYRLLSERVDYPLHLGVTEAGPPPAGLIKGVAGIATLLNEGIGDTIRFSLTADPVEEAKAGRQLLEFLSLRERKGLDLIACPSCGRAEVDVIDVATRAQAALEAENLPIQVAVMGCVVNGPGEAREADIGIAAGRGKGHLFIKGQVVRVVPEAEMVEALLDEARKLVEEGVESRLAHAEANAAELAAAAREQLIQIQGDANRSADRRARVAEVAGRPD
jgi:(E)-4-hydroxy-3-methylbut-2-enyl-diphosphate synthase